MTSAPGQLKGTIVDFLYARPMTLSDLVGVTDVSLPTLRRSVQELIDTGWVRAVGQSGSTGGRPATLFGLDGGSRAIIGAHVEIPSVNMVLAELGGRILHSQHHTASDGLQPDEAVEAIAHFTAGVKRRYPDRQLMGIGMAAPGYVDATSGEILYVGRARNWRNFPMKTRLESDLGLPLIMENDTDCLIRAEIDNASPPISGDVVYLAVLEGVKMSMLLNGQLYRGPFGNAGLIGRTRIAARESSPVRPHYELEETASVGGLCDAFTRLAAEAGSRDSLATEIEGLADRNHRFRAILQAAEAGHPIAAAAAEQMIADLALALANLLYVLQPLVLVIGGQLSDPPQGLRLKLERQVREALPQLLSNHLIIRYATMTGRYAAALGATYWFLRRYVTLGMAFRA